VYCEGRLMYGVRADGYKYVEKFYGFGVKPYHWGGQQVSEYHELYDLQKDTDELYNIAGIDDEKVSAMKKKLYALRFKQPCNVLYAKKDVTGSIAVKEGFFYTVESEGVVQQVHRQSCRFKLKEVKDSFFLQFLRGHNILLPLTVLLFFWDMVALRYQNMAMNISLIQPTHCYSNLSKVMLLLHSLMQ
ncbi:MAG TPA: hypothetical protein PLZ38_12410, partial [Spirochaetota bacterium]|nr:hypothetical protein [Spirochaetota bacterium]